MTTRYAEPGMTGMRAQCLLVHEHQPCMMHVKRKYEENSLLCRDQSLRLRILTKASAGTTATNTEVSRGSTDSP